MTPVTERVEAQQQMLGDPQHLRSPQMDGDSIEPEGFGDQRLKTLSKNSQTHPETRTKFIGTPTPGVMNRSASTDNRLDRKLPRHTRCTRVAAIALLEMRREEAKYSVAALIKCLSTLEPLRGMGARGHWHVMDCIWMDGCFAFCFYSSESTVKRLFERI